MAQASPSLGLQRQARRRSVWLRRLYWAVSASWLLLNACTKTESAAEPNADAKGVSVAEAAPSSPHVTVGEALTAELMVQGVSCASCSLTIRRELRQLEGVMAIREGEVKTHLLVDFDGQRISAQQLLEAVHRAGYDAEVLVRATKS